VAVDSGITVSDLDNTTLASPPCPSPAISIALKMCWPSAIPTTTFGNISASYNSGTGVLTLSSSGATATLAQWQAALRAITYTDSAITPNSATRTISFSVNDGSKDSTVATRAVTVTATDQTPIVTTTSGNGSYMLSNPDPGGGRWRHHFLIATTPRWPVARSPSPAISIAVKTCWPLPIPVQHLRQYHRQLQQRHRRTDADLQRCHRHTGAMAGCASVGHVQ
jgi:hypothetical protein